MVDKTLDALQHDYAALAELYVESPEPVDPPIPTWKAADGDVIPLLELEDSHLQNAICFLQRRLVYKFGTSRWVRDAYPMLKSLVEMLDEAAARGLEV